MKTVKVEWCENFIKAAFGKHHPFAGEPDAGIEANCFWRMAQKAGLWEPGIYGGPMSQALEKLTVVESVHSDEGTFLYNVFRLNPNIETYSLEYGNEERIKKIRVYDFERALEMFKKIEAFAEKHNLTWTISLWEAIKKRDHGWLIQSVTTNPTAII